jgi:cation transport ATPase
MSTGYAIDHDSSRTGRWLRQRRLRFALWIAVIEVVLAAFTHDISRLTIVVLAAVFVPIYFIWGRDQGDTIRQITWIAAGSQALAVVAALLAYVVGLLVLVIAGIFAAVALFLIFTDRR